jgi:hypothetical protein
MLSNGFLESLESSLMQSERVSELSLLLIQLSIESMYMLEKVVDIPTSVAETSGYVELVPKSVHLLTHSFYALPI